MNPKLLATLLPLLSLLGAGFASFGFDPKNREIQRGVNGGAEGSNIPGGSGFQTGQGGGIGPLLTALVQQQQQQPPVAGLGPSLGQLLTNMQAGQQFQNAAGLLQLPTLPQRGQRQ